MAACSERNQDAKLCECAGEQLGDKYVHKLTTQAAELGHEVGVTHYIHNISRLKPCSVRP